MAGTDSVESSFNDGLGIDRSAPCSGFSAISDELLQWRHQDFSSGGANMEGGERMAREARRRKTRAN